MLLYSVVQWFLNFLSLLLVVQEGAQLGNNYYASKYTEGGGNIIQKLQINFTNLTLNGTRTYITSMRV